MTNEQNLPLAEEAKMLAADYVLGELSPEEEARFEAIAEAQPELLQEVYALQTTLAFVPQTLPTIAPPPDLKEKIVLAYEGSTANPTTTKRRLSKVSILRIVAGITALTTLLLGADNLRLRNQLQIAQEVDSDRVATILRQPNSRLISLQGTAEANTEDSAAGTLLFTPGNWQEVIVSLGDLPPLPPEEIYRMWLALENGEVIYCGEFDAGDDGSVYVRFTPTETPPKGVKTTELFVTIDRAATAPDPLGPRVMQGSI